MGCYVNPKSMTKTEWLEKHAIQITLREALGVEVDPADNLFLLCEVNNIAFQAIIVVLSEHDRQDVTDPRDGRPKRYFLAEKKDLLPNSPLQNYLDHIPPDD